MWKWLPLIGALVLLGDGRVSLSAPDEPSPAAPPTVGAVMDSADATAPEASTPADLELRLQYLEGQVNELHAGEQKSREADALKPTVKLTAEVQTDFAWFGQSDQNRAAVGDIDDGADFRRARLGAYGEIFERIDYRTEFDFAFPGRPSFLDNWVGVEDVPAVRNVRVGYFFEPFSLERLTSNRYSTFMERSLADRFTPRRHIGLMAFNNTITQRMTWAVGAFRTGADNFGDDIGDAAGWAATGRLTWLPWYDEAADGRRILHLGGGYSFRAISHRTVQFAERPEIRMAEDGVGSVPAFVDTGVIPARNDQLFGIEAALVLHSFSLQSEYMAVPVNRTGGPALFFQGMYVYASYFLTGEHREYRRSKDSARRFEGVFDRITPRTNAFKGPVPSGAPPGFGAWEVAVRWSHLDLNSRDIAGGRLHDVTFGLNWYLNPYTRVTWNYIHPVLDRAPLGRSTADVFAMRFAFDF